MYDQLLCVHGCIAVAETCSSWPRASTSPQRSWSRSTGSFSSLSSSISTCPVVQSYKRVLFQTPYLPTQPSNRRWGLAECYSQAPFALEAPQEGHLQPSQCCSECNLVEQVWIYGNSYESTLVAVVVPDEKSFKSFAQQAGAQGSTVEELCKDPKVGLYVMHPVHTPKGLLSTVIFSLEASPDVQSSSAPLWFPCI